MRRILVGTLMVVISGLAAAAGGQSPGPIRPSPQMPTPVASGSDRELGRLLDAWEAGCRGYRTLGVRFEQVDRSPWGDHRWRGQALFGEPDRAACEIRPASPDDGEWPRRFVLADGKVADYRWSDRTVVVVPDEGHFLSPGARRDWFPLMLLFRADAAGLEERYEITLPTRTADLAQIRLRPRRPGGRQWQQLDVWLDPRTGRPDRLRAESDGGRSIQEFRFSGVGLGYRPNIPVAPAYFQVVDPPGWRVDRLSPDDALSQCLDMLDRVGRSISAASRVPPVAPSGSDRR